MIKTYRITVLKFIKIFEQQTLVYKIDIDMVKLQKTNVEVKLLN